MVLTEKKHIEILLADDHKIVRDGLRELIEAQSDMRVIAEAENGRIAVKLVLELCPDVVVMDIGMPDVNGIEATRQIMAEKSDLKIVALSMHAEKRFVAGMFRAGASGYLLKDCAFDELVQAVHTVVANQVYLSPQITGLVVEDYVRRLSFDVSETLLTDRERGVIQLLAEGWSTKEIASHVRVSSKTIETYRRKIMEKLNLHSIAELTKYAIQEGLVSIEI